MIQILRRTIKRSRHVVSPYRDRKLATIVPSIGVATEVRLQAALAGSHEERHAWLLSISFGHESHTILPEA